MNEDTLDSIKELLLDGLLTYRAQLELRWQEGYADSGFRISGIEGLDMVNLIEVDSLESEASEAILSLLVELLEDL